MKPLLMWGLVPFSLSTLAYDELVHEINFKHAKNERIGRRASAQYLGAGEESITLSGELLPLVTGGRNSLELLRFQGETGLAFPLIEATGRIFGFFKLEQIHSTSRRFERNGAPNIIAFSCTLFRVGDDKLNLASLLTTQLGALL